MNEQVNCQIHSVLSVDQLELRFFLFTDVP